MERLEKSRTQKSTGYSMNEVATMPQVQVVQLLVNDVTISS